MKILLDENVPAPVTSTLQMLLRRSHDVAHVLELKWIVAYGVVLVGTALFVSYWWKRGNIYREHFGNWRKQSLTSRYTRGRRLMPAAGFLAFFDGFLFVVTIDLAQKASGVLNDLLGSIDVVLFLLLFACFGLCLTVMLFKWPQSLVPPWARDGKKARRR